MLKIGTTLILSEVELKHYKKLILSKYPCKEEVAYRKKIEEQKKIIEDQGHELYNQNKTIEFLKSELDKKKESVKTSTIKIDDAAKFTTINMNPSREEVCDMINKSLEEAKEARRADDEKVLRKSIENELRKCRGDLSFTRQKYIDLKASYDNLLDEQRSLKCNDEKLNEAKLIIDALQKENADLKAKLSDREAHACPTVKNKEYEDLLEAFRELKGKYEEAVKDATLSIAEKQQLVDQTQHLRNDIDKHRINANKYRNDAIKMASMILKIDTLSEEARKYLVIEGKKYQVSNKVYNNICSFISIARKIASRYKDYVDMEKYKEYIEFEFDDDSDEE